MSDRLFTRLLYTRDNLKDVCEELSIELPTENDLSCIQCTNCYLWVSKRIVHYEDDIPVCNFCHDMDTLRF